MPTPVHRALLRAPLAVAAAAALAGALLGADRVRARDQGALAAQRGMSYEDTPWWPYPSAGAPEGGAPLGALGRGAAGGAAVAGGLAALAALGAARRLRAQILAPLEALRSAAETALANGRTIPPPAGAGPFRPLEVGLHQALEALERAREARRDLQAAADARTAALTLLGRILEAHVMVTFTDHTGAITWANEAFLARTGRRRDALVGQPHQQVSPEPAGAGAWDRLWPTVRAGGTWRGEACYTGADGLPLWVDLSVVPHRDADGEITRFVAIHSEITAQKEAELEARRARDGLEGILSALPDLLFVIDQDGVFIDFRAEPQAELALPPAAFLGRRAAELFDGPAGEAIEQLLNEATHHGRARGVRYPMSVGGWLGRAPEIRWFEASAARQPPGTDGRTRVVVLTRDITNRVVVEEQLQASSAALQRALARADQLALEATSASAAKSAFLANMSHEIRTPLNGVLGMVDLLLDTELGPQQRAWAGAVRSSGEALLRIVNDVLDLSKIEAGRLQLEPTPTDLRALLADLDARTGPQARARGLGWSVRGADALPARVLVDPLRLRQILDNLCGNALKFTHTGSIGVDVRCTTNASSTDLDLSVHDTGIGVAPDRQPELFAPFVQADASTTRRYGGTGLGLAICDQLARAMGGALRLESELGRGSTFTLRLRLPVVGAPVSAPPAPREAPLRLRARVLLVEDNEVNQLVTRELLTLRGAEVDVVDDGAQALDRLREQRYDVVLMDCHMPVMDGFDCTRAVRDPARGALDPGVPILALTANAFAEDAARCLEAGMDAYLAKPARTDDLVRLVREWAGRRSPHAP